VVHVRQGTEIHGASWSASGSARELLGNSSAWAVMLCRFFIGPVMQFYWYWTPSYLYSARHMTMVQIGFVAWIPFLMGDVGGIAEAGQRAS